MDEQPPAPKKRKSIVPTPAQVRRAKTPKEIAADISESNGSALHSYYTIGPVVVVHLANGAQFFEVQEAL